jgi:hypothetical protein
MTDLIGSVENSTYFRTKEDVFRVLYERNFWQRFILAVERTVSPPIMMFTNEGSLSMLENSLCSFAELGLLPHVLVWAADEQTVKQLERSWAEVTVFNHEPFMASSGRVPHLSHAEPYGSANFRYLAAGKLLAPYTCAALGFECVFQDVDVVWNENVLPALQAIGAAGYELGVSRDSTEFQAHDHSINSGFMYVNPGSAGHAKLTFSNFISLTPQVLQSIFDQTAYVRAIEKAGGFKLMFDVPTSALLAVPSPSDANSWVARLPLSLVANGYSQDINLLAASQAPVFHANWCTTVRCKFWRLWLANGVHGTQYAQAHSTCCPVTFSGCYVPQAQRDGVCLRKNAQCSVHLLKDALDACSEITDQQKCAASRWSGIWSYISVQRRMRAGAVRTLDDLQHLEYEALSAKLEASGTHGHVLVFWFVALLGLVLLAHKLRFRIEKRVLVGMGALLLLLPPLLLLLRVRGIRK